MRHGTWRFSPVNLYLVDGEIRSVWSAADALVIRAVAQLLGPELKIHHHCLHIKGHGGVAEGIRFVKQHYHHNRYVWRSDVKGYYRHIRDGILMRQLGKYVREKRLLHVLRRYLARSEIYGGVMASKHQGLNKGCPLAPLLGGLYLKPLDIALS